MALLAAVPARAQDAPKPVTLSGFAAFVSDYRFRGVSRSDLGFAAQGSFRLDSAPGFYAATFVSSVAPRANGGADAEVDFYGGWTGDVRGWKPDAGVYGYVFPGGRGRDFYEVYADVSRDLGPLSGTLGVTYAPAHGAGRDNAYVYGSLSAGVPRTPVTLKAGVGYEDGVFADHKLDWNLGASLRRGRLSAGLSYVDASAHGRLARAGPVVSVSVGF